MDETTRRLRMGQTLIAIKEFFDKGNEIEYESLINELSFKFGSSRRTSIEYIQGAMSQIPSEIVKDKGIRWIIPLEKEKTNRREA